MVIGLPQEWDVVDEVDERNIRAVKQTDRIVSPSKVGFGDVVEIATAAVAGRGIDRARIGVTELQLQVMRDVADGIDLERVVMELASLIRRSKPRGPEERVGSWFIPDPPGREPMPGEEPQAGD